MIFYVDLPCYDMGRLKEAAKSYISSYLFSYEQVMGGTIMAYQNVRPFGKLCRHYADLPYNHIKMQADVLLFQPYPGCQLPATVTFASSSAVSLQILDTFRGYVNMHDLRAKWEFSEDKWHRDNQSFGAEETVVVEVEDVMPSTEGIVLNVKILRHSDVPVQTTVTGEEY